MTVDEIIEQLNNYKASNVGIDGNTQVGLNNTDRDIPCEWLGIDSISIEETDGQQVLVIY